MAQRNLKSLINQLKKGCTIIIYPNGSNGKMAGCRLPFSILLLAAGIIVFNISILLGFSAQVWQVYRCRKEIGLKQQMIRKLQNDQREMIPTLQKSHQMDLELTRIKSEQARLTRLWIEIRQKGGHAFSIASRGASIRTVPYQLRSIPSSPETITSQEKLRDNLSQLNDFIHKEEKDQNQLLKDLMAYDNRLDHTPSFSPVDAPIVSGFGMRFHPILRRYIGHEGVDLAAEYGTKVRAAADGVVSFAGWESGYGYLVKLDHGYGYETCYGHNSRLLVHQGEKINKGQVISLSGNTGESTGPHLHFEVRVNGTPVNPVPFLKQ